MQYQILYQKASPNYLKVLEDLDENSRSLFCKCIQSGICPPDKQNSSNLLPLILQESELQKNVEFNDYLVGSISGILDKINELCLCFDEHNNRLLDIRRSFSIDELIQFVENYKIRFPFPLEPTVQTEITDDWENLKDTASQLDQLEFADFSRAKSSFKQFNEHQSLLLNECRSISESFTSDLEEFSQFLSDSSKFFRGKICENLLPQNGVNIEEAIELYKKHINK